MIQVIRRGEVGAGRFEFSVPSLGLCGKSRQPLLDACRMIKQAGGGTRNECGLFRPNQATPDLTVSSVEYGAAISVREYADGGPPLFRKYEEFGSAT